MSMTADQIVDRRRLRRKLTFWRVAAFVAAAVAILAAAFYGAGDGLPGFRRDEIARVSIAGFITDDRNQIEMIDALAKNDGVRGVIVAIDSTGGASAGGEALYEAIRRLAEKKPTVAQMGTVGASAAYMAAIATDHIVARRTTITGSIGVVFQYPEVSELLDHLGVKMEDITSGPLKAQPSPFKPATEEARQVIASVVGDIYGWFVDIVASRRGLARSDAMTLADGRIYTGQQALRAKLIDEIGGEQEAIAWLATRGVDKDLPIRDWKPKGSGGWFSVSAGAVASWIMGQIGLDPGFFRRGISGYVLADQVKLDGVMSVWQAPVGGRQEPAPGAPR